MNIRLKKKILFSLHLILILIFVYLMGGYFLLLILSSPETRDEYKFLSAEAGNRAIMLAVAFFIYLILLFSITKLFKSKENSDSSTDRAREILGKEVEHLSEEQLRESLKD